MSRAVLSLGSNLGDRLAMLRLAVTGLGEAVRAVSPVYETAPWGVLDQPDFLNAVVIVEDDIGAWDWLRRSQALETQAQRVREIRWGPRTLDVDVVTVDEVRSDDPELLLPHPGAGDRASVLVPWHDIDPDAVLPGRGPIRDLLAGLDSTDLRRLDTGLLDEHPTTRGSR
ncbi:2-amino-4-hydroxy-6-hydroxymethyldihydropteridine diphosphokinase [Actinoalloteichus hymeniacidonis]|uniref:2-amino-4-hydroxy-6-hydroxymethyldihydropteridine diphosphokinase n=1 Tax=Actinoalloteichus hymeniacidonis TaxID=340345 RepID=A0AAC9HLU5_9PSEU|nr:2-amino-4-hydroxy-6-hydroxymethyldihydropteridine diphosphokinase [Actinoalloteichus hymeniacidonis]AOS61176.1 2-amino-4-hydroxy-6-hydroxymethyldihydropteridine diphosphokinase [Actinoalloteichus hymeniacidonis]MBB5910823.1 2-amino-4-hydroxy-6-hydroxymethyldihydropteridine diphosphokinase [Actinoalloteichus hymeniacidonis]